MMRIAIFILASWCLAMVSPGRAMTLEESMAHALRDNPEFAAVRARTAAAIEGVAIARAPGLPQLQINAVARSFESEDPQRLRAGDREQEDWTAGASLSQLLYASGRVANDVRGARARAQDAIFRAEQTRQRLLLEVTRSFADVRRARAVLDAQERSIETLVAQRAFVEANRRQGFLTATDLAQADGRLAQAVAQASRARAELMVAEEAFVRIVGRRPQALSAPGAAAGLAASAEEAAFAAERDRPAVKAAEAAGRAAQAAVRSVAAEGGPRITLEAGFETFGRLEAYERDGADDETIALRLVAPLFTGGGVQARTRAQRLEREALALQLAATRRQVREEAISAWSRLDAARSALEAAGRQTEAAELALRGVRREQENGLRSVIDVLDQERELLSARIALANAERDVVVSERELLFAIGALWSPQA